MKVVIFDLDGTLVDSAPDIHGVTNALLRSMGYQPQSLDEVRSFIGNGIPKLVERVMRASDIEYTSARHAELTETFLSLYAAQPVAQTVLYPSVRDALETLGRQEYRLGVCTNKSHAITLQVLQALGIADLFGAVVGGDSLPQRKPDPAPLLHCAAQLDASQVIYVGDSEVDAGTAEAAGVPFILFTEGYRKTEAANLTHAHRFDDFAGLPALVDDAFRLVAAA